MGLVICFVLIVVLAVLYALGGFAFPKYHEDDFDEDSWDQ